MKKYAIYSLILVIAACAPRHGAARYEEAAGAPDKSRHTQATPWQTVTVGPARGQEVKNVVLMIGDGMGLSQMAAAWTANHGRLNLDNCTVTGLTRTWAADRYITDSGAAGTALATGQKTRYHAVGIDTAGREIPSLTDLAAARGLGTAVVVTCSITDGTPAAFCASQIERDEEDAVAADYLRCNVDFIFGGGRTRFSRRQDGRDLLAEMGDRGYQICTSWEEVQRAGEGRIFAPITEGQLALYPERGAVFQEACLLALERLDRKGQGFFAMFEGSRIDDCGHWNDMPKLINEISDFDQTIGRVLQWAEKDGETLVIVVADHETGGLILTGGEIGKGFVQGRFMLGDHSGIMVPLYAWGPGAEKFTGIYENSQVFAKITDLLQLR